MSDKIDELFEQWWQQAFPQGAVWSLRVALELTKDAEITESSLRLIRQLAKTAYITGVVDTLSGKHAELSAERKEQ